MLAELDSQKLLDFISDSWHLSKEELALLLLLYREAHPMDESEEDFWKKFSSITNKPIPDGWMAKWEQAKISSLQRILGMLDLANTLKKNGYRLSILSNVRKEHAALLKEHRYYEGFDPVLLSCETGIEKPDPAAYSNLLSKLSVPKEEVLFIDNEALNVESALRMGIDSILFFSLQQLIHELKRRNITC